jgi:hypothetical protein
VFAWFGYHEIGQPGNYTQYVPFISETSHAATILVSLHGGLLMALAAAFFLGLAPRLTAAVAVVLMLEIVADLIAGGLSDTTFRDVGVLGLAVVLTGCKNQRLLLRLLHLRRHVPAEDHRFVVLRAKLGDRAGVEAEQAAADRFEVEPAGGEDAQHMTVRDQDHVAVGQQRPDPGQHPVRAFADRLDRFARMVRVAGDDPVAPQVPVRPCLLDLRGGQALVAAVIPLPQIRVLLGADCGATES